MRLESGELDTQIAIEKRSEKLVAGEIQNDWADLGSFWGKLSPLSPRNLEVGKGFAATVNYQAYIRYRPEVTNDCRVKIKGQTYNVNGVIHDPQKDWTQLFLSLLTN